MKIKNDFVTNSSSTSFMLHGVVQGRMTRVPNLKKIAQELGANVQNSYSNSISMLLPIIDLEGEDDGEAAIIITNSEYYPSDNEDADGEECSFVDITIGTPYGIKKIGKESVVKQTVKEILSAMMTVLPKKNQEKCMGRFSYLQYPEASGDGWNTGDPMGEYQYVEDLYRGEVASGEITIEGKDISMRWNVPQAFSEDFDPGGIDRGPHRKLASNKKV